MELEHSFSVPVGIERAWEVLLDVETIAPCMPGAALDTIDGDAFTGTVKVKLGPIGLTYKGKASFVEKDETTHRAVIDAQGRDARGNGTAKATVTATLSAEPGTAGAESTKVVVATDLAITGKPAQFGRGVMVDVGNKLIGQFADCLAGKLAAGAGGPAGDTGDTDGTAAPTAADAATGPTKPARHAAAAAVAPGPPAADSAVATSTATAGAAAAATPTAGTGDAPAASGPATAPAANRADPSGTNGSTGPRKVVPIAPAEPIDLMASAGPAVAKRLLPVGAGVLAVAVALLVWWRRR